MKEARTTGCRTGSGLRPTKSAMAGANRILV